MYCILIDAHLSNGAQLAMHDVLPLMGIDRLRLVHTAHVPPHYTCPSTLHMSLHTTHVPPHYTCSSTLHMSLHTTHVPPHYTCPSTLHMSLHTTHVPPHYTCPSTLHMSLHTTHVPPHYTCPSTLHMSLHTTHVPPHYTCPSTLHISSTQSLHHTVHHPHEKALSCTDVCWEYIHPSLSMKCSPISAPHPS